MPGMLRSAVTFPLFLSDVLTGSSLLSAAQRKMDLLSGDLQGTFLLDRRGGARGSLLPPATIVPVAFLVLPRLVMAMIAHGSQLVFEPVETFNHYFYLVPRQK